MTLASRISAALGALSGQPAPLEQKASVAQSITMSLRVGQAQWPPAVYRQLAQRYSTNPIVHACVRKISDAAGEVIPIIKVDDREDHAAALQIDKKLQRPNPTMGRSELIGRLAAFDALHGNAFVEMADGIGGEIVELWAPRPDKMQIIPASDGGVMAYRYEDAGRRADFPVDEQFRSNVLHIKRFAPLDDLWGVGALLPAARDLAIYDAAQDIAKALFDNAATPSGALVFKPQVSAGSATPTLSAEQVARIKSEMEAKYQGAKNAGKPMVLDGGLEWMQMGMTMVDLGAEAIRNEAARGIARAFGVPAMMLGIPGDNTYSNYAEANRAFYRETVLPITRRIYSALAGWLTTWMRARYPLTVSIDVDPDDLWALQDEVAAKWQRLNDQNVPLTINERREAMGYDRLEQADDPADQVWVGSFSTPLYSTTRQAEANAQQAEIQVEQMLSFPGYDPAKDADGDGKSGDGTSSAAGEEHAVSKVDGKR